MAYSENKTQYNIKYAKDNLKRIPLDVQKEKYDEIAAAATSKGETVNGYIKRAIDYRMTDELAAYIPASESAVSSIPAAVSSKIQAHIPKTGETADEFISRAAVETMERDAKLKSMGIDLKNAIDERKRKDNN